MARHLFIVARQHPDLFSYLSREFSAEPEVTVIVDRRQGERRTTRRPLARVDRRRSERRTKAEIAGQLSTLGYAFVRLPDTDRLPRPARSQRGNPSGG